MNGEIDAPKEKYPPTASLGTAHSALDECDCNDHHDRQRVADHDDEVLFGWPYFPGWITIGDGPEGARFNGPSWRCGWSSSMV